MARNSFFEKLTGAVNIEEDPDEEYEEEPESQQYTETDEPQDEEEVQLAIDLYQTSSEIIIQTMVAGVRPDDLNVQINREMVTIEGKREGPRGVSEEDYFHRELYWGPFKRTIVLPDEVDVDNAEATENHGLLIIKLPKINKDQRTRLKVKSQ